MFSVCQVNLGLCLQDTAVEVLTALQAAATHRDAVEVMEKDVEMVCKMVRGAKPLSESHTSKPRGAEGLSDSPRISARSKRTLVRSE